MTATREAPVLGAGEKFRLILGDSREKLAALPENSVDAVVTDPPYELGFMGKSWDAQGIAYSADVWGAALRVLKPGGHLLAFGGSRTYHRIACAIEDSGFEIRDCIMWIYGSGFPKSLDVSKAIDKQRHDRAQVLQVTAWVREMRDRAGVTNAHIDAAFGFNGMAGHWTTSGSQPLVPTLDQWARLMDVLGVNEVPPEIQALADLNGMKGQPGAAWFQREVVGERIKSHDGGIFDRHVTSGMFRSGRHIVRDTLPATEKSARWHGWGTALKPAHEPVVIARKALAGTVADNVLRWATGAVNVDGCRVGERWPANVIHDGSDEVLAAFPAVNDGSAASFFYCAKASKADRDAGNIHPTVKPTDLMRYLCRLVTPPGGIVLDPFTGSGSTGKAALLEGFRFVGIERESEYIRIAQARIGGAMKFKTPDLFTGAAR